MAYLFSIMKSQKNKDYLSEWACSFGIARKLVPIKNGETPEQWGLVPIRDRETGEDLYGYRTPFGYRPMLNGMREETDAEFKARLII